MSEPSLTDGAAGEYRPGQQIPKEAAMRIPARRPPWGRLFASLGFCCRGLTSTYRIIAGRCRAVTGPYLDPAGTPMMNAGGMEVQGTGEGMIGPGSESVFTDGGRSYLVYHYYDAFHSGDPWVQVRPLMWAASGWPVTGAPLVPVPGAARSRPAGGSSRRRATRM